MITDRVYSELFNDAEPDSTKAALALHHAVKYLRETKRDKGDLGLSIMGAVYTCGSMKV